MKLVNEVIANAPERCTNCKNAERHYDIMGGEYADCNLRLTENQCGWQDIDCEKFDPRFATVKSEEGYVAKYDFIEMKFLTPWVDYQEKKLICPVCDGIDWELNQGLDSGNERCLVCGFYSCFVDWSTFIGPYVSSEDFRTWQGKHNRDNCWH